MRDIYLQRAKGYCNDILSGHIHAPPAIRANCERFQELLKGKNRAYMVSEQKVRRVCRFAEMMPHVEGFSGDLVLEPWQCFFLANVFGVLHRSTGLRRYRTVYLSVARKNGKSMLASVIGLYMMVADRERGAQVYSAARGREQAKVVFRAAKTMMEMKPEIRDELGIEIFAESLTSTSPDTAISSFQPVSREHKNLEGKNPHCAIVDELHVHPDDSVRQVMIQGMGARRQPLLLQTTTAGTDTGTFAIREHRYAVNVALGKHEDPQYFAMPYGLEDGDDWTDEALWQKANPNLGVSVYPDNMAAALAEARAKPEKANDFKAKRLNLWSSTASAWLGMETWKKAEAQDIDLEAWKGSRVWAGLDLAATKDLTALALVRPVVEDRQLKRLEVVVRHYLPERAVREGDKRWAAWMAEKIPGLTIAGDRATDYNAIQRDLVRFRDELGMDLQYIGCDPHNATLFLQHLEDDEGFRTVDVRQGVWTLSEPSKFFEMQLELGVLKHQGCPLLTWQAGNVTVDIDDNENIKPSKKRSGEKIDGIVACVIALSVMMGDDFLDDGDWQPFVRV